MVPGFPVPRFQSPPSNDSGVVRNVQFSRLFFGTFRVEANIITRRHEVPYRLSSDPKMLDFNDLEMPFYAKKFFHRRFD